MRQISGEGNAAAQAECVLRRHGGGKPEGKEGVQYFLVRGREVYLARVTRSLREGRGDSILQGYGNGKYQNSIPVYISLEMPRM